MTNYRSFGIELECFHPTQDFHTSSTKIVDAIRAMGFKATSANYTGREYDKWQVKPDGSLSPYGKALELVAPTLKGTPESFEQVRKVVEWMSSNGFDVNKSCGYHVHIGCADLTVSEQAAVAYRYHLLRADINAVLPPSRHNGSFCSALDSAEVDKVKRVVANPTMTAMWGHHERRVAVNLEHASKMVSQRRIEFRQHSGTLNVGKVMGWYKLLCEFIDETVRLYRGAAPVAQAPVSVQPNVGFAPVSGPRLRRRRVTGNVATVSHVVGTHQPRVPYIESGSDYDKFLSTIEQYGVVTQSDARIFGWPATRLRVTAHWLRQRGAALVTTERNGELAYVGSNGARTRHEIFVREGVIRVRTPAGVTLLSVEQSVRDMTAAAPAGVVATVARPADPLLALAAPLTQGLTAETLAWYRQRREDFGNT